MASQESSSSLRILQPGEIGDYGLIFLSSRNPLDLIVMAITKQEFSDIGIYFPFHGTRNVIIATPLEQNWFKRVPLTSLLQDPNLTSVAVKRLDKDQEPFLMALIQVLSLHGDRSQTRRGFLRQLAGVDETRPVPCCGVDLVNKVIEAMGKSLLFSDNNTVSTKTLDELDKLDSKYRLLAYLCSNLSQASGGPRQMQSYVVADGLFSPLHYLELSSQRVGAEPNEGEKRLKELFGAFLDELGNEEFYQTVCRGVTEGRKYSSSLTRTLTQALSELSHSRVEALQYIMDRLAMGEIHISHLRALADEANQDAERVALFSREDSKKITIPSLDSNIRVILKADGTAPRSRYQIRERVKELHQMILVLVSESREGQGFLEINRLVSLVNELKDLTHLDLDKIPELPDNSSYSVIARSSPDAPDPQLRFMLDSGKEVTLSLYGADLSIFNREELLEILEALDSSESERLDNLRALITAQLARY